MQKITKKSLKVKQKKPFLKLSDHEICCGSWHLYLVKKSVLRCLLVLVSAVYGLLQRSDIRASEAIACIYKIFWINLLIERQQ